MIHSGGHSNNQYVLSMQDLRMLRGGGRGVGCSTLSLSWKGVGGKKIPTKFGGKRSKFCIIIKQCL